MKFLPTAVAGAYVVEPELLTDERGFFARLWCPQEFAEQGIDFNPVQSSVSHTERAGTVRGLHFYWPPSNEAKLIRCERGRIFDAIVDLRPQSPSFGKHFAVELDADLRNALFVPAGCAQGFQTLLPDSAVLYTMNEYFVPELAGGVRFDDPAFGIEWPLPVSAILQRDRDYADFDAIAFERQYTQIRSAGAVQQ